MEQLLRSRISTWEDVRAVTRQPGISIGVNHQGQEILRHHAGVVDIENSGRKLDSDILYCIASLSKAFIAASLAMLIREGKTSWYATVQSVVPDFQHTNPEFDGMTIRDICSHRTGLLSLDEVTQGLDGRILIDKKDVVKVCNAMPVKNHLRSGFLYNNGLFELAGHIVERLSATGHDEPLDMTRTTAFRDNDDIDKNFAKPYMILTDGTPVYIPTTELSADSMNGGSGGVRSSVNDLLKWSHCLLASFKSRDEGRGRIVRHNSPIFSRCTIADPQDIEAGDYCMGFCLHRTPAKLGLISPNRTLLSPTVGVASPSVLVYSHQGDVPGYTCNIYIIPESESAVVVLSNGTGLGDATDWIAQDIIQTLFDLQPKVDFLATARTASELHLSHYEVDFRAPLAEHRGHQSPVRDLKAFAGTYVMEHLDVAFVKVLLPNDPGLQMLVNGYEDQAMALRHSNHDVFSYLPESYDECLKRGLDRTQWSAFLLSFERDGRGMVVGLRWALDGVETRFKRL
ncbi:beta-lactamase/transpeptidase-like protein [Podospora aff. communis PSN243]|uniref:Beta-lactamase/transpeptidase-like protein n=1 Tax=Podospora aff. communis PSN243 TaxID=3040156 RepID=A0AAV9GDJ1_9PEZI|nr:beta-lactamase/transpeptidase-like protein [Podospora aff. communis PSN243]